MKKNIYERQPQAFFRNIKSLQLFLCTTYARPQVTGRLALNGEDFLEWLGEDMLRRRLRNEYDHYYGAGAVPGEALIEEVLLDMVNDTARHHDDHYRDAAQPVRPRGIVSGRQG